MVATVRPLLHTIPHAAVTPLSRHRVEEAIQHARQDGVDQGYQHGYMAGWRWGAVCGGVAGALLGSGAVVAALKLGLLVGGWAP